MRHEILTTNGKLLYPQLAKFEKFYLAGGTALALQIGHRRSMDFDMFSDEPIKKNLIKKVEDEFKTNDVKIISSSQNELTVTANQVKLTFLNYPFPPILPLEKDDGLQLLSAKEIAVTKAYTLGRRGEWKDYIDLYFCLKEKIVGLQEIIDFAQKKYAGGFNDRLFLEQLLYWGDVEITPIEFLRDAVSSDDVKKYFKDAVKSEIKLV